MSTKEVQVLLGNANKTSSSSSSINSKTSTLSSEEWTYVGEGRIKFENDKKVVSIEKM